MRDDRGGDLYANDGDAIRHPPAVSELGQNSGSVQ